MTLQEIYKLAINKGIESDLRGADGVGKILKRRKEKYEKLLPKEKEEFDLESLENPFSDSRILNVAKNGEIKKVLAGIDIEPAEILLAKEIQNVDLIIAHHPQGKALASLHEVMELQCDILNLYGVPINIAECLMKEKISEVARGVSKENHQRAVDAANILKFNFLCLHTAADNLAAKFLKEKIEEKNLERVEDLMDLLKNINEYKEAVKFGAGPQIFVGSPENRCGKIAVTEITGGTEGSAKLYEKMAQAGIGTIVGMHISEEHKKEAENAGMNVVIAGHMSSDSLGMNLILDELEKRGIEIVPCSGLIRVSRN